MRRKGNQVTAKRDNNTITRNTRFFKLIPEGIDDEMKVDSESDTESIGDIRSNVPENEIVGNENVDVPAPRRSVRVTAMPVRYPMGVRQ